jgi:hypothetical protein
LAATRYDTSEVQDWLYATSYPALEVGDGEFRLAIVGRPETPLTVLSAQSRWDEVRIAELQSLASLRPGQVLPVEMKLAGRVDGSLKLSLRLVDPNGQIVAQQDKVVEPQVRLGLFVPPVAAPGTYLLAAVLYDPATLQPILDTDGLELAGLTTLTVTPSLSD